MDPLSSLALVGTAREAEPPQSTDPIVRGILSSLPDLPLERRILLAAGARAAAAMAGHRPSRSEKVMTPSPAEALPECSARATRIMGDLLAGHHPEVLPEALTRLAGARQRLPHGLLPAAFRVRGDELRAAIRSVIGERGVWLARLNESWAWAAAAPAASSFEDLERAWTEGTSAARRELLVRAREIDPPRARGWLEATWPSEKADERAVLLRVLRTGLSKDDEAFLEAQLRDRASSVREAAQAVLMALESSAYVSRMTARADAMLDFKPSALSFVGKRGTLTVTGPEKVDEAAERDGLTKPPPGVGAKAFWLVRAIAAVPVSHWTARWGVPASQLVAAAGATDWSAAVCEGWARAALLSGQAEWLGALWEFFRRSDEKIVGHVVARNVMTSLLQRMPSADGAERVAELFEDPASPLGVAVALALLPKPWPARIGMRWLEGIHRELRASAVPAPLLSCLSAAALALPPECFDRALDPVELPEGSPWERHFAEFLEKVRMRHDLHQEIVP